MWFGFWDDEHNGGVTRYYQGVYTHYRVADGLASGYVTAFYEDLDHSLLIATTGPTDQTGGIRRVQQGRLSRFAQPT